TGMRSSQSIRTACSTAAPIRVSSPSGTTTHGARRADEERMMAEIVLGVGTSHSPSLSMGPEWWSRHGTHFDPKLERIADFEERCANAPEWLRAELDEAVFRRKHAATDAAIEALGDALRASRADVVVVVGDDQKEMFTADELPALALFTGDRLVDRPDPHY